MLQRKELQSLYNEHSANEIAKLRSCSVSQVNYWLSRYKIQKRSISEAIYKKHNPKGDPFIINKADSMEKSFLHGLGLGLYWGEGTKSNRYSIRLGNTNSRLIKQFIEFLKQIYSIEINKLKFGIQVFNDSDPVAALDFWIRELNADPAQFQKVIISKVRGEGTYKNKSEYGVLTVYYHNKKLRNILCGEIEKL